MLDDATRQDGDEFAVKFTSNLSINFTKQFPDK